MGNLTPTARERQFLRAIAAPNPSVRHRGDEGWWSAYDLQHTPLHADFRTASAMILTGLGRSCERKGMAASRRIGGSHGWSEYRITSFGRGLVADSCIGGGLPWIVTGTAEGGALSSIDSACPACRTTAAGMGADPDTETIPAHPLPGYLPETTTPEEN